jgi:quercetin dioxygenase-like cupin family protein
VKETLVQTLSSGPAVDTLTITHVPAAPELLHAAPGAVLSWVGHSTDHHVTVVSGTCKVLDRRLVAGGSAYVPAGMAHAIKAGAWGCTFFSTSTATTAV